MLPVRKTVIVGVVLTAIAAGACGIWMLLRPSSEQRFQNALAATERENWPEVLRLSESLKGDKGFEPESHLLRSIYWLKTDRPTAALNELGRVQPEGRLREPALLYAGEALYRLDRLSEAERVLVTLVNESPDHLAAHRWLAAIAYDLGDMNRAMTELSQMNRLSPNDYRPYVLRGQIQFDLERFADAASSYQAAVSLTPPAAALADILPTLARTEMEARNYDSALKALKDAPLDAANLALAAQCHLNLGSEKTARDLIDQATAIDPEQIDVLRLRSRLELDAGRADQAIQSLQKLVDRDPHDHTSRHELAQAFRMLGKTAEAEQQSQLSAQSIDLKARLSALSTTAIERPGDAKVRDEMAELCERLGKPLLADTWRKAAAACRQSQGTQHTPSADANGPPPSRSQPATGN